MRVICGLYAGYMRVICGLFYLQPFISNEYGNIQIAHNKKMIACAIFKKPLKLFYFVYYRTKDPIKDHRMT
jgi:hypothetical protein